MLESEKYYQHNINSPVHMYHMIRFKFQIYIRIYMYLDKIHRARIHMNERKLIESTYILNCNGWEQDIFKYFEIRLPQKL